MNKITIIPIFYACDDNYAPYMAISLLSLMENSSKAYQYNIHILTAGLNKENTEKILQMQNENFSIKIEDINNALAPVKNHLTDAYYFSINMYFRIFIQNMFLQYDKAIYLDCDTIIKEDISKLFKIDLQNNLVGAVQDQIYNATPLLHTYAKNYVGLDSVDNYFTSGVLLLNLEQMRNADIEGEFIQMITKYNFGSITPDQDYLNVLCKNQVKYLPLKWNCVVVANNTIANPSIIHYALFKKPWFYPCLPFGSEFDYYMKKSSFKDIVLQRRKDYKVPNEDINKTGLEKILTQVNDLLIQKNSFKNYLLKNI